MRKVIVIGSVNIDIVYQVNRLPQLGETIFGSNIQKLPGGKGLNTNEHAASISKGSVGLIHGFKAYVLQDEKGEILPVHSIAAGLDYPGVGPEHSYYHQTGRGEYVAIDDKEALNAFFKLSQLEGIIPAIESSHAIAYAMKLAKTLTKDKVIIVNLSGRGDKDISQVIEIQKTGL